MRTNKKVVGRMRRHRRVRKRVTGTLQQPRLSVYRSLKHIYAQIVDDSSGRTQVAASSLTVKKEGKNFGKMDLAKKVGETIAALAKAATIERVVFDRGGYLYHGRVKALAEAARASGLVF